LELFAIIAMTNFLPEAFGAPAVWESPVFVSLPPLQATVIVTAAAIAAHRTERTIVVILVVVVIPRVARAKSRDRPEHRERKVNAGPPVGLAA
jgi:hypothetical protein